MDQFEEAPSAKDGNNFSMNKNCNGLKYLQGIHVLENHKSPLEGGNPII